MPMLALNGLTIPTAKGGSVEFKDIGDPEGYAFDGTAIVDIRARKRVWKFKTKPVNYKTAQMLRGMIRGDGYTWNFDTDVYSTSGKPANAGSVYSTVARTAADGKTNSIRGYRGMTFSANPLTTELGTGALWVDQGGTNLLSAALAAPTSAWTGSSLSTAAKWIGTNSILIAGSGTASTAVTVSYVSGDSMVVGCWAYNTGASQQAVNLFFTGGANLSATPTTFGIPADGQWHFIQHDVAATGAGSNPTVAIGNGPTNGLHVGGITVFKAGSGTAFGATYYIPGGTTRASGSLSYPINPWRTNQSSAFIGTGQNKYSPSGLTINFWALAHNITNSTVSTAISIGSSTSTNVVNQIYLIMGTGLTGTPRVQVFDSLGANFATSGPATVSGVWNMITVVFDTTPTNGTNVATLTVYTNGVAGAPVSLSGTFDFSSYDTIYFGNGRAFGGTYTAPMDEIQVLPFPVSSTWATQTLAYYNGGAGNVPIIGAPLLQATGLAMENPSRSLLVQGRVTSNTYVGFQDPTLGWHPQGEVLEFTLREV